MFKEIIHYDSSGSVFTFEVTPKEAVANLFTFNTTDLFTNHASQKLLSLVSEGTSIEDFKWYELKCRHLRTTKLNAHFLIFGQPSHRILSETECVKRGAK